MSFRILTCLLLTPLLLSRLAMTPVAADTEGGGRAAQEVLQVNDYACNMEVTVSGYSRPDPLTNFPVLVRLSENLPGFFYSTFASATGNDLRFADSTGALLSHDVDAWDTGGESTVWVNIPVLTNNTTITAYWGNPAIAANPAPSDLNGSTWNDNYEAVWHMQGQDAVDATTNAYNGTGGGNYDVAGVVNGAQRFDYNLNPPDNIVLGRQSISNAVTVEAWINKRSESIGDALLDNQNTNFGSRASIRIQHQGGKVGYTEYGVLDHSFDYVLSTADWHHVVWQFDDIARLYVDAALVATNAAVIACPMNTIGAAGAAAMHAWTDEIRVSTTARSTNWIWATWMTSASNDVFTAYGPVQCDVPVIANASATSVLPRSAVLGGNLLATGAAPATVSVYWGGADGGDQPTAWGAKHTFPGDTLAGPVSTNITGLAEGATYYYRFYATNSHGAVWADATSAFLTTVDTNDYGYSLPIELSGYNRPETLTNFPALVKLSDGISGFSYGTFTSDNGYDLRFTDPAGRTLSHEIERWDTSGESAVWVRIPTLTSNTEVRAWWGNPRITSPPAYAVNGSTWDDDYVAVWHLSGNAPIADSTANGNDAVSQGTLDATGLAGGAQSFGGGQWATVATHASLHFMDAMTVEVFAKSDQAGAYQHFVNLGTATPLDVNIGCATHNTRMYSRTIIDGVLRNIYGKTILPTDTWYHLAWRYDGAHYAYLLDASVETNLPCSGPIDVAPNTTVLLGREMGYGNYFRGLMDEVRISRKARSDAWLEASQLTLSANDTFVTYGEVEGNAPAIENDVATGITGDSAQLNGTVISTGSAPTSVSVLLGTSDGGRTTTAWERVIPVTATAGTGAVSVTAGGLNAETLYYYRFHATNAFGAAWATPADTFETDADPKNYTHSMPIAFPGYTNAAPLTNFPALVTFDTGIAGFAYTQLRPDAYDLLFQDSRGMTLSHELDIWDTNGTSTVWVRVPELKPDTVIRAYWGNTNRTAPPANTTDGSTWSASYQGVWHLGESAFPYRDSTPGNHHGTAGNAPARTPTGKIGAAQVFTQGSAHKIDVPFSADLNPTTLTVSAWARLDGGSSHRSPLTSRNEPQSGYIFYADPNATWAFWNGTGAGWTGLNGPTAVNGRWTHLAGIYSGGTKHFYVDGVAQGPQTTTLRLNTARPLRIGGGATEGAGNYFFEGGVDEVRVSNVARSEAWIMAEYNNGNDPASFLSRGAC